MKIRSLFFILFFLFVTYGYSQVPDNLLSISDEAYIPSKAKFHLYIESYEKGEKTQYFDMESYVNGHSKYLLIYQEPAIMKGQGQVRIDSTIYQYVRKTDRTQQVSAKTNFYKTVLSQEDVMSSMLSSFYEIEKVEEVVESDNTIYRMTLNAKEKRSSYATIVADIDSETYLPIKRLYYSYSGQLVKEFLIEEIKKNENGELDFVRFKVTDMIKPQYYSIVIMDQFDTTYEIPENMFSVPYLKTHVK